MDRKSERGIEGVKEELDKGIDKGRYRLSDINKERDIQRNLFIKSFISFCQFIVFVYNNSY